MAYEPKPEHHFTFGLWTLGHQGRDPFGNITRPGFTPVDMIETLAPTGAYGILKTPLMPPE
jgi:xylose isomerase